MMRGRNTRSGFRIACTFFTLRGILSSAHVETYKRQDGYVHLCINTTLQTWFPGSATLCTVLRQIDSTYLLQLLFTKFRRVWSPVKRMYYIVAQVNAKSVVPKKRVTSKEMKGFSKDKGCCVLPKELMTPHKHEHQIW